LDITNIWLPSLRAGLSVMVAIGLTIGCAQTLAAGFDCSKATSWVEKRICTDPALSKLDGTLAATYRKALDKTADAEALRASQRTWLTQRRDACTSDACLSEVYHERLQQLNRVVAGGTGATDLAGSYTRWFQGKPDSSSAEIKLRPLGGGQIFATGEATWLDNQTGVARTGSFEGTAAVAGRRIHYSDGNAQGCGMTITVAESTLSVENDSGHCGGLNVTFDGDYRKAAQ